ncbi:MAG: hypothetical protein CMO01_28825 [Thalassobius sp.]|nr:hypothetical protein [Thalassovita sp.]
MQNYINCLILMLLLFSKVAAQDNSTTVIVIDKYKEEYTLPHASISYFTDDTNELTIEDIISTDYKYSFHPFDNEDNELESFHAHWIKLNILSRLPEDESMVMFFRNISEVNFYEQADNDKFIEHTTGEFVPGNERQINKGGQLDIRFKLRKGKVNTYYIKVRNDLKLSVVLTNFRMMPYEKWIENKADTNLTQGIFQGFLWMILLTNFFFYLSLKDKAYLYYALYVASASLLFLRFFEFGDQFLFQNFPRIDFYSLWISNPALLLYIQFFRLFINMKKSFPEIDSLVKKWIYWNIGFQVLSVTLMFIHFELYLKINFAYNFISFLFIFFILVNTYRKTSKVYNYFLAGSLLVILGGTYMVLSGILSYPLPPNPYFLQICIIIEIIIFSIGLSFRYSLNERNRERAQQQLIEIYKKNEVLQKKAHKELEEKVNERTKLISEKNDELQQSLDQLQSAQSKLIQSEKMASLGQLTAGIAHEINNPVNFISGNISPLRKDIEELKFIIDKIDDKEANADEVLKELLELKEEYDTDFIFEEIETLIQGLEEGSTRTKEIVKGLRYFSRTDADEFQEMNLHEGINSSLILLHNKIKNRIEIKKDFQAEPTIYCLPGKLNQVFMNLLTNSIQAIDSNGIIQIGTKNITVEDQPFVEISIQDNGTGISEEDQNKIFEPFFTTKEIGQGTGLGLSISYGIIQQHKGNISVESEIGKGTTFYIQIPVQKEKEPLA